MNIADQSGQFKAMIGPQDSKLKEFSLAIDMLYSKSKGNVADLDPLLIGYTPPAGAPIKSIFVRKGHAKHHFYELFELISTM